MALDGAFLRHIKIELEEALIGFRVEKYTSPPRMRLSFPCAGRAEQESC